MRAFDPQHTPQELQPAKVNPKRLFLTGAAGWLVALIAAGAMTAFNREVDPRFFLMCVTGLVLGTGGYAWAHQIQKGHPQL